MPRKQSVSPADPDVNGRTEPPGDAREPDGVTDTDTAFDPADLEEQGAPATPDPFDPAYLGLSQDFPAEAGVARKWDIIKVEKPSKARVFRVHPDPAFRVKTVLLSLKEDNETYLVLPELRHALAGESTCGVYTLLACVTKAGTPFLWPIRMPDPDGKWNVWHQSAWQVAEKAQARWCRMQANRDAGHYVAEYDQRPPERQQPPDWPDLPFSEWLRLAFQGHAIDSLDHRVLKRLRLED
jgi:hypothetical protein